jgi:hypothetical protein
MNEQPSVFTDHLYFVNYNVVWIQECNLCLIVYHKLVCMI